MPSPESVTLEFVVGIDALHRRTLDAALAREREFDGVGKEVSRGLAEGGWGSASDGAGVGIEEDLEERTAFRVGGGADGIDSGLDNGGEIDAFDVEADFAGNDAAHIEQVADDLGLGTGVAFDDFEAFVEVGVRGGGLEQDVRPAEDGIEGGTQFMGEGGEEFVLFIVAWPAFGLPGASGAFAGEEFFAGGFSVAAFYGEGGEAAEAFDDALLVGGGFAAFAEVSAEGTQDFAVGGANGHGPGGLEAERVHGGGERGRSRRGRRRDRR